MKSKSAIFPGLSLFFCFCLITGAGKLLSRYNNPLLIVVSEAAVFLLPTILLVRTQSASRLLTSRLKSRRLPRWGMGFTIRISITAAILSLCLNEVLLKAIGFSGNNFVQIALDVPQSGFNYVWQFLVTVILAPVVEEVYLRGTLLAAHECIAGTGICILMNGVFFAMLHGNLLNFAGPLVTGACYAYLAFIFRSVEPAIIAHAITNLYYLLVNWLAETYAAFGIWKYFLSVNGLLLLFFLYLSLRSWEKLLTHGSVPYFSKSAGLYDVWLLIRNLGTVVFILTFAVKVVLHWI